MEFETINFGSLYHLPKINVVIRQFDNPSKDFYCIEEQILQKETPFVPLEITEYGKLQRVKILLTDGSMWYLSLYEIMIKNLEEL